MLLSFPSLQSESTPNTAVSLSKDLCRHQLPEAGAGTLSSPTGGAPGACGVEMYSHGSDDHTCPSLRKDHNTEQVCAIHSCSWRKSSPWEGKEPTKRTQEVQT